VTDERSAADFTGDSSGPGAEENGEAGFGARLAAEREQRGLSQADVARALNLRVAVIVAIEEENFAALPKMAFVRGYARSYARLLDVAEAEIAEALVSWRDPSESGRLPLSPAAVKIKRSFGSSLHGHAGLILTVLSLLVAVLLAAILVAIWPEGGVQAMRSESSAEPPATSPATRAVAPSVPRSAPGQQLDAGVPAADAVDGEVRADVFADDGYDGSEAAEEAAHELPRETAGEAPAVAAPDAPLAATQETRPAPPVAERSADPAAEFAVRRESAEGGRVLRVFAGGEDHAVLSFSSDCWVEIRDAEDRGIVSDLGREGRTIEVFGQGPFRMLLGYARGVELSYNGEPVGLAPHTRNNIASLVVGR
jgi:cytoskeleton protein RodZ